MLEKSITEVNGKYFLDFWATDITTLNDSTERELFVKEIITKVEKYAKQNFNSLNEFQRQILRKMCYSDMYVISFTTESLFDDLNMWRGYGGNGTGACLEMDFSNITKEDNCIPQKCDYKLKIKDELIESLYTSLSQLNDNSGNNYIIKNAERDRLNKLSPFYKHEAYKSEKEARIVIYSPQNVFFNKVKNVIKPYTKYSIPLSALTSIRIGPCIKDSYEVKTIVSYIKNKLGSSFKVEYSKIPYRG